MNVKDITDEVTGAKQAVDPHTPSDVWEDYIDWKAIRGEGYDAVRIGEEVYEFTKWGLKQPPLQRGK